VETFGLEDSELEALRLTAENVYRTPEGRVFIDALLEDLQLYDEPFDERSAIMHGFGMKVMQKYFGKFLSDSRHRSELTEAIMKVVTPEVTEE